MIRKLKNLKHFLAAFLAYWFYQKPAKRLMVVGVTGTDGKTTTVELIYHLLSSAGFKTAKISTLGAKIGSKEIKTGLHVTTPDSRKVQRLLRQAVNENCRFFVMEATSHGLDQHRLFGCHFWVGVLTNVTREHLDYHGTFKRYQQAKTRLFREVRYAVLNRDDPHFAFFNKQINEAKTMTLTYGLKTKAYLTPRSFSFKTKLQGDFNLLNCLAAIGVAKIFEIPDQKIRKALLSFNAPKGRFEEIETGRDFKVIVDFAHTPGAFRKVIPAVRKITKGKIIHVFGCTGDRDQTKRPVMGATAAQLSDLIILTHEDTYKEKPEKIICAIEPGVQKGGKVIGKTYWKVTDREEAIRKALNLAQKGDTVLITGVGHQQTLNIGGREEPWSERAIVQRIIGKNA